MKIIEIHTPDEVSAEVVVLRADTAEVMRLMQIYVLRPWCFEGRPAHRGVQSPVCQEIRR